MSDHYHAIHDTQKSIDILNTVREILKVALSYRPEKEKELLQLQMRVEKEVFEQRNLLNKLNLSDTLGHEYQEELEEIKDAHDEAKTIQKEVARIQYEQKTRRVISILNTLQKNRNYIEQLLMEGGLELEPPA